MSTVDRRPAPAAARISVLGGLVVVVATFFGSASAALVAVPGFVLVVVGIRTGWRIAVTLGTIALLGGTLVAGVREAPIPAVVAASVGTVLAWDMSRSAIDLGHQLGTAAVATRPAIVHATGTALVGSLSAGVGYGVYLVASSGKPAIGVVFLLLSVVLLVYVLD